MIVYYSDQAYQLAQWAREENNRVKASHIMQASKRLEQRKLNNLSSNDQGHSYPPYGMRPPKGLGCFAGQAPPYGSRPSRTK